MVGGRRVASGNWLSMFRVARLVVVGKAVGCGW